MPSESGTPSAADAVDTAEGVSAVDDGRGVAEASEPPRDAEAPAERGPIEWGPVSYDRLRSVAVGALLTVVAGAVLLVGGAAASLISGAASGEVAPPSVGLGEVVAGVGILVALAVTTVPYLYVWYRESNPDERSLARLRERAASLRPGWTLAGVAAVLVPILALPTDALAPLWPLLWVVWLVPALGQATGGTARLDPTAATVERTYPKRDHTRTDDLGAVIRTRRIDLPWTTLFLLAYRGNAWYRSTPWLFVPTDRADEVESALDDVLAASDGPDRASVPERLTLATLGSFSLVVGVL
ncbi:MAG: hypothetical protein ACOC06_06885, partial [Halorubrum sp.]